MKPEANVVTFRIDGKDVAAAGHQTILQVARENGIDIPTLCYLDGLSVHGGCRLCVVEIAGMGKLQTACSTFPTEGMQVTAHSPRLEEYRKRTTEFLFSERNHVCAVCVSNGHCELQDMAQKLKMTHVDVPYLTPKLAVDASHPRFVLDHNRCIMCTRCVRVCAEIEGAHTWDVMGRGIDARVVIDDNRPWGESETCTSCGKCVHVCPTGALSEKGKSVAEMQKLREFLPYLQQMREADE